MALDTVTIVIPILGSVIASFVILMLTRHLTKTDKVTTDSTVATINLTNVQGDLEDLKNHVDKKFDEFKEIQNKRDEEWHKEIRQIWEKVEHISSDIRLIDYRVDRVERNGSHLGGKKDE